MHQISFLTTRTEVQWGELSAFGPKTASLGVHLGQPSWHGVRGTCSISTHAQAV